MDILNPNSKQKETQVSQEPGKLDMMGLLAGEGGLKTSARSGAHAAWDPSLVLPSGDGDALQFAKLIFGGM